MNTKTVKINESIQTINLSTISADPNQPRKTFNESKLKELANSILEHGLLQPITVRPSGKSYIIVMGERRYRASKLAKLKTIHCIVRDFDSKVISEVQIIENLQRQDVEAIEEAEAINFLLKTYKVEEIATRIGRTVQFIYGRIKLANLIEGFRPYVRNKKLNLSDAIRLAVFTQEEQEEILKGMGDDFYIYSITNAIERKVFDLNNANFSLSDKNLIKKAGACNSCPFNSINEGNLFGEKKAVCRKSICFSSKKTKTLIDIITQSKKSKKVLVFDIWGTNNDSENVKLLALANEHGQTPYTRDDVLTLTKPIKPTKEGVLKSEGWDEYTEDDLKKDLKEALEQFESETKEYKEASENGYVEGICIDRRTYESSEVLVKMRNNNSNSSNSTGSVPLEKKKMDECTPKEQVKKIQLREIRKKEIEANKEFEEIMSSFSKEEYVNVDKDLSKDEMVAITITMQEKLIGYYNRDLVKDIFHNISGNSTAEKVEAYKNDFKQEQFNKLVRLLIVENVSFGELNHLNNANNHSAYAAIKSDFKKEIEKIEATHALTRSKREEQLELRIKELLKEIDDKK